MQESSHIFSFFSNIQKSHRFGYSSNFMVLKKLAHGGKLRECFPQSKIGLRQYFGTHSRI